MDFWTAAGIWGIVALVVINTVMVAMEIFIAGEEDEQDEKRCAGM